MVSLLLKHDVDGGAGYAGKKVGLSICCFFSKLVLADTSIRGRSFCLGKTPPSYFTNHHLWDDIKFKLSLQVTIQF